jgi:DNA-binding IclR family transcriptional regulator
VYCYNSNMLPAQPNQSLMDGMTCLQAVAVSPRPLGVLELAERLGLEPTRVHRLLKTLAHIGFTRQTLDRKYEPGPGMHVLFAQSLLASGLIHRAREALVSLQGHGLAVALGVRWTDQVCYLYHASSGASFADGLGHVRLYPATRSSIGMVLLSWLPVPQVRAIYHGREIPGYPQGSARLLKDLRKVRRAGFAKVTNNPSPLNVTMGVPVGEPPEAALALAGSIPAERAPEVLALLRNAAARITDGRLRTRRTP